LRLNVVTYLDIQVSDGVARDVGVNLVTNVDLEGGEEAAHAVVVAVVAAAWDPSVDVEAEQ